MAVRLKGFGLMPARFNNLKLATRHYGKKLDMPTAASAAVFLPRSRDWWKLENNEDVRQIVVNQKRNWALDAGDTEVQKPIDGNLPQTDYRNLKEYNE